ncbi:MAG: phage integrase SAM-like domain-containing protein [Bacteroides sp.]|nr:phage integrase SAM-like domain-containing protein [Bacteroides sp.]
MATFKVCVQKERKDGFYPVYIRVTHHRGTQFIKTDKMVTKKELSKSGEVEDPYVMQSCTQQILEYNERLNRKDIENWTVKEVVDFLMSGDDDICFSDYARQHAKRMIDRGQERNARNYVLALNHLERFAGTNRLMFSHLTSQLVNRWIKSLETTHRAKEMYPICMRQVYKAAMLEYNDYDMGIIRIKVNPWVKVEIPSADRTEKLAITPEQCREFFSFPIPDSKLKLPLTEFGRDIAMMVLCLAGINTVDLYNLRKKDYENGIIKYQRAKTKKFRADGAYMEMRVPAIIQPLFEKYRNTDRSDEHLFNFYQRMTTSDSFNANANSGIKQLCRAMGMAKEERYSVYTFRHTWGTVAQNDVRASISEVAFAMNHSSGHNVTRGYIKIDYSPAWELNEKVIDFIFFSGKASSREQQKQEEVHFRLSYRFMVNAAAYHNGQKVAELTDVGFNNVDEVIARLVTMLPGDIPDRSIVMFKIVNMDKDQTVVYQRQKGKGF